MMAPAAASAQTSRRTIMVLSSVLRFAPAALRDLAGAASRAFRLITETTCDAIRPAQDIWPPGALHVDGAQNRYTADPSRSWGRADEMNE